MFTYLKSLLRNLILPPQGLVLLGLIGLVLLRWHRRLGLTLIAFSLISLWVISMPVVSNGLQRMAERYPALDLSHPVDAQAVVILAGGGVRPAPEFGGLTADGETLERLDYGAYVSRRTSLPVLITGSPAEADAMQLVLARSFNITPRWVENRSGDTFQNARFSSPLLRADHVKRVILVTSSTHEWRAAHEFMDAGIEVVPAPVGIRGREDLDLGSFIPNPSAMMHSYLAVYELIGEPVRIVFSALHLRRQQPQS
jgi:uncharacterized SAM-binding protein YcdF (DUF218 family)